MPVHDQLAQDAVALRVGADARDLLLDRRHHGEAPAQAFLYQELGSLRPTPNARLVTFSPVAACFRLYSF